MVQVRRLCGLSLRMWPCISMERVIYVVAVMAAAGVGTTKRITWEKDGSKMALIPAGSVEMGDHFNEGFASERPLHKGST